MAWVGLVHDKPIEVLLGIARALVTSPGSASVFVNQPETSATSWMVPADPLCRATFPLAPTAAITRFGMVWAVTKFTLEDDGRVVPSPYTLTNPARVGAVTVRSSPPTTPPKPEPHLVR